MSRSIVLRSFAELAEVFDLTALPAGPGSNIAESPAMPAIPAGTPPDLADLLSELEAASATLATIVRQDQEARTLALRDLEQYDAVVARKRDAEQALAKARQVHHEAEALARSAFTVEARAAANSVVGLAVTAEDAAACLLAEQRAEAERLAASLDLERLLAERRRQEEAEKAKAAEAERAGRLSGALAQARAALEAGRIQEAKALLGPLANENPDNAEIASLLNIIAQRELAVKISVTEDALWAARREYRRNPAEAVARLEALDVDGLPATLTSQLFGEWARACARLCRERQIGEPLRYAPDPGRGAVLARDGAGSSYVVVSALGMGPSWQAGSVVGERQIRRARPLR